MYTLSIKVLKKMAFVFKGHRLEYEREMLVFENSCEGLRSIAFEKVD